MSGEVLATSRDSNSSGHEASRPSTELLTAWLLQLLDERVTYGYRLHRELDARGVRVDPGTMYRRLSKLEQYGWVESRWLTPAQGPRRRLYRLTRKGRRALDEIAPLVQARHEAHEAFVLAYDRRGRDPGTTGGADMGSPARSSSRSEPPRPGRTLLTAWLLLLLDGGESYGYELNRRLGQARATVEPSVLYRRLRALDGEGCVESRWGGATEGPPRHVYGLTGEGRTALDELGARICASSSGMNAFLEAHRALSRSRPTSGEGGEPESS
jgi:DNA-binding PadR family transcriptional regulator